MRADAASAAAAAYDGGFPLTITAPTTRALRQLHLHGRRPGGAGSLRRGRQRILRQQMVRVVVTRSDTQQILFEYDCGTSSSLGILPRSDGGKTLTWFKGYKYYGGFQYARLTAAI